MKLIVEPEAGSIPVIQAIQRAKTAIDVSIFRFDRKEIEQALGAAVQRGVKVRALIAHTNRGGESALRKLEQRLLAAGIMVTRTGDDLLRYHGKMMVADDVLYLFGFNFTKLDIERSRSFAIATRDRKTVKEALRLFESDCTRQTYSPGPSNLVVSPETARPSLARFLRGARTDLAIYDVNVQDKEMVAILEGRAKKGVRVRLIGKLKGGSAAIAVRALKGPRLHVRAIVRDGTRAFVGSQSLRADELDIRREVGLLISNPSVTRRILQVFEADWESAKPKNGAAKPLDLPKRKKKAEIALQAS